MSGAVRFKGIVVYNFDSLAPKCITAGVVNKRTLKMPKPSVNIRPPEKDVIVAVQIVVDINGAVTAAKAVSGHSLIRFAFERAARQAKFSPMTYTGPPVKVRALLVYKFKRDGTIETDVEENDKNVIGTPVNLVEPATPSCSCRGLGGVVLVQVKIDEQGNVTQAAALSGHPVLRKSSENAALASKFLPTDTKAKILIAYNFQALDAEGRAAKFKDFEIKKVEIYEKDSGETVVGKAVNLAKPPFPSTINAKFNKNPTVLVEAKIDENGNVISARVISGHPALFAVCVQAARFSKFFPTTVSGVPVKAGALITYEYIPDDEFSVNVIVNGVEADNE
jgi:outer membrane biosynthesis protein TonB